LVRSTASVESPFDSVMMMGNDMEEPPLRGRTAYPRLPDGAAS
jgi:hypothetical protein